MSDGIFNVLKPPGMTSHDVIAFLRRVLNTKKVGHGGTLDPDAAGVLPVFTGTATRLLEFAVEGRKQYLVEVTLGKQTDTGDDSGSVVKEMPVPEFPEETLQKVLQSFLGKQKQLPPMYSAIKINGQKLYQLARKGVEVERELRDIEVYKLELLNFTANTLTLAVDCSKGTYIRVLGEDIATALGTCGTMSFLLRTQVGSYHLNESHTLQEIADNSPCHEEIVDASLLIDFIFDETKSTTKDMAILHYVDGLTLEETAKMMKMSVSGVRKRLSGLRSYAKQFTGE